MIAHEYEGPTAVRIDNGNGLAAEPGRHFQHVGRILALLRRTFAIAREFLLYAVDRILSKVLHVARDSSVPIADQPGAPQRL